MLNTAFENLNQAVSSINDAKSEILSAISAKGILTEGNEKFSQIPPLISAITQVTPETARKCACGSFSTPLATKNITLNYNLDEVPNFIIIWTDAQSVSSLGALYDIVILMGYTFCKRFASSDKTYTGQYISVSHADNRKTTITLDYNLANKDGDGNTLTHYWMVGNL